MHTAVRVPTEDGDVVNVDLDKHWLIDESENVAKVYVQRFAGDGGTELGRIDRKEHVYHVKHHGLADFVRWSDRTTTLGIEELMLASEAGVTELAYFDEQNSTRYTISLDEVRATGFAAHREKIGWRWVVPLTMWAKRRVG